MKITIDIHRPAHSNVIEIVRADNATIAMSVQQARREGVVSVALTEDELDRVLDGLLAARDILAQARTIL